MFFLFIKQGCEILIKMKLFPSNPFTVSSNFEELFTKKIKTECEVDETELHVNLDIFMNSKCTDSDSDTNNIKPIIECINRTHTRQGLLYLQQRLSQNRNITTIKHEQQLIIYLLKNPLTLQKINNNLQQIADIEEHVLWCLENKNGSDTEHLTLGYFQNTYFQFLNRWKNMVRILNLFVLLVAPFYSMFSPIIVAILPYFYFKLFTKVPVTFKTYMFVVRQTLFKLPSFTQLKKMSWFALLSKILSIFIYTQSIYGNINTSQKTKYVLNHIHTKCNHLQSAVNYTEDMETILQETPLQYSSNSWKELSSIFKDESKVNNTYFHNWVSFLQEYSNISGFHSTKPVRKSEIRIMLR